MKGHMKELKIKIVDFWDGFDYQNHMIFVMPVEKCMRRGIIFCQKKYLEDMRRVKYARDYPIRAAVSNMGSKVKRKIIRILRWKE